MLKLIQVKRTHELLLDDMEIHYSKPKGFVGRNICYLIFYNNVHYGAIVGGSATLHLPGRNSFFKEFYLENIVNNTFYHIEKQGEKYPIRNFAQNVLKLFRWQIAKHWKDKYGDKVLGFESLVELPRKGEIYIRDNWSMVGTTKGFTAKRPGGVRLNQNGSLSVDSWGNGRVWNKNLDELRPKLVFCKLAENNWN